MTVCVIVFVNFFFKCVVQGGMFPDVDKHSIDEENKQINSTSGELVSVLKSPF